MPRSERWPWHWTTFALGRAAYQAHERARAANTWVIIESFSSEPFVQVDDRGGVRRARRRAQGPQVVQRQIEGTGRQSGALVYELYGLTDEEVAVVEGTAD